jgi:hypothetical protein
MKKIFEEVLDCCQAISFKGDSHNSENRKVQFKGNSEIHTPLYEVKVVY